MFERFTDRARRVLVLAQDEAAALDHNFLGTEHVLLGLLAEGEGVGAKALQELGLEREALREKVVGMIGRGEPGNGVGPPPFTPRAKKVLELALREALDLGHNYIGTEHQLLALVREGDGVAAQALLGSGLTADRVRAKVIDLLRGFGTVAPSAAAEGGAAVATPAVRLLPMRVKAKAGTNPAGSHHYLQALLEDGSSLAARVLESLGVTKEAVDARIREIGVAGTTDEVVPPKRPTTLPLGEGLSLIIDDPELAREATTWLVAKGEQGGNLADWLQERRRSSGS